MHLELLNLRNKVLGLSNEESGAEEVKEEEEGTEKEVDKEIEYMEKSCPLCTSVNKVPISDIEKGKNTIRCVACGHVMRVKRK